MCLPTSSARFWELRLSPERVAQHALTILAASFSQPSTRLPPSICKPGRVSVGECRLCLSLVCTRQIPELSAWNPPESTNSWVSIPVRRQLSEEHLAPVSILSAAPSHIYFRKKSLLGREAGGKTGSRFFWLLKEDHPVALSNKSYIFPTKNKTLK